MSGYGQPLSQPFFSVIYGNKLCFLHRCAGCSSLSGVAGAVFGSPIFLVKTHLQTSSSQSIAVGHQHRHTGFISALQHVYQEGGVAGLWRGATASLPRICRHYAIHVIFTALTLCFRRCWQCRSISHLQELKYLEIMHLLSLRNNKIAKLFKVNFLIFKIS